MREVATLEHSSRFRAMSATRRACIVVCMPLRAAKCADSERSFSDGDGVPRKKPLATCRPWRVAARFLRVVLACVAILRCDTSGWRVVCIFCWRHVRDVVGISTWCSCKSAEHVCRRMLVHTSGCACRQKAVFRTFCVFWVYKNKFGETQRLLFAVLPL